MADNEIFDPPQNVSYLQARDPSILSWNRHGIERVRHNLVNDFESESTIPSIPSEKEDKRVKVCLRIKASADYADLYAIEDDTLICKVPQDAYGSRHGLTKKYQFSHIFSPETTQLELFNAIIKPKILNFINGYNSTLLAYGSSGAGKTFTMVGTAKEPGIIPRALEYLFRTIPAVNDKPRVKPLPNGKMVTLNDLQKEAELQNLQSILHHYRGEKSIHIKTYRAMQQRLSNDPVGVAGFSPNILSVYVSFTEIYNEFVYDLLQPPPARGQQRPKLTIGGLQDHIYIKGLKYVYVQSGLDAFQVLQYGISNLKYAETAVNQNSSRSHCIFSVRLVQGYDPENSHVSTFNFCDLAGSERVKKTMNVGDRLKESNNINNSLSVLGRCISTIRDGQCNKEHKIPPFRDSKLTQIFQKALMGKEDIVMIVNINSSRDMFNESQHTLNFAGIAKEIIVVEEPQLMVKPNRFSSCFPQGDLLSYIEEDEREEELRELRNEIATLVLELSDQRQEFEEILEAERNHLRVNFQKIIDIKDAQLKKLEEKNKKLLEERRPEVIVLSDDESDEEDEEVLSLRKENLKFKTDIYNLNEKEEGLRNELDQKSQRIKELEKELTEANKIIEDAKKSYKELLSKYKEVSSELINRKKQLFQLEEDFEQRDIEWDSLLKASNADKELIETLEEEKRVLLQSIRDAQSPTEQDRTDNDPQDYESDICS